MATDLETYRERAKGVKKEAPTTPLAQWLLEEIPKAPYAFDFFQTMRMIECAWPKVPRLGTSLRASDDPIRLGQDPSTIFPPASLSSFTYSKAGKPRLNGYFFGLFGPHGALPLHLTEYARERLAHHKDPTFAAFADVFHHRMLSLLYRAWANAEPTIGQDRPTQDPFAMYTGALFGIGANEFMGRDQLPDTARLYFAGLFAGQTRHAEGLKSILRAFFDMPVDIEEFVGGWMNLPPDNQWQLGSSRETGALGISTIVGSRVWGCQQKFRIRLGPLGLDEYRRLLPGGSSLKRLVPLVRQYVGDELDWDLQIILKHEDVPPCELGKDVQLGWSSWMTSKPMDTDPEDLYLQPLRFVH